MSNRKFDSVYTVEQWQQLEATVFDDAGDALQRVRDYARANRRPPIAFLVACALYAITATPGRVQLDAGVGPGAPNMFVVLMARPGGGKDQLINAASDAVRVFAADDQLGVPMRPKTHTVGSGEGVLTSLQPEQDGQPGPSVLFTVTEVGLMGALAERQGSTLRPHLLNIYSGGALALNNRKEKLWVEPNSYRAGMVLGAQPDKAGFIVSGQDDGFKHRFVFVEVLDPLRDTGRDYQPVDLHPVVVPSSVMNGTPMGVAPSVRQRVLRERDETLMYGPPVDGGGHRMFTTLKLAMGLALLRSGERIEEEDYQRAEALMVFSDAIARGCEAHLERQQVEEAATRLERKDAAEEAMLERAKPRARARVLEAVQQADGAPVPSSPIRQGLRGDKRPAFDAVLGELAALDAVHQIEEEGTKRPMLIRGAAFDAALEKYGESYPS